MQTQIKYNYYIGLNDKDTKRMEVKYKDAIEIITGVFNRAGINCFSIYKMLGCYTHFDGTKVFENSIKVEVIDNFIISDIQRSIKKELCVRLNQEDILITMQQIDILELN